MVTLWRGRTWGRGEKETPREPSGNMLLTPSADGVLGVGIAADDAQVDKVSIDVIADFLAGNRLRYVLQFVDAEELAMVLTRGRSGAAALSASGAAGATRRDRGRARRCESARPQTLGQLSAA